MVITENKTNVAVIGFLGAAGVIWKIKKGLAHASPDCLFSKTFTLLHDYYNILYPSKSFLSQVESQASPPSAKVKFLQ